MNSQIFDNFDRTEFSDEIFAMLGRILTISTRFDASAKILARMTFLKPIILIKDSLNEEEYDDLIDLIFEKFKNLNNTIDALKINVDIKDVLTKARKSRNEFIHEATLGFGNSFDSLGRNELSLFLEHIKYLTLDIIRGEILILAIISIKNNESISDYLFSINYEYKYLDWVLERFEK